METLAFVTFYAAQSEEKGKRKSLPWNWACSWDLHSISRNIVPEETHICVRSHIQGIQGTAKSDSPNCLSNEKYLGAQQTFVLSRTFPLFYVIQPTQLSELPALCTEMCAFWHLRVKQADLQNRGFRLASVCTIFEKGTLNRNTPSKTLPES